MINVSPIRQYNTNFKSKNDYSQIYKDMKDISLKKDEKITPKISFNDTFSSIKQTTKNNMPRFHVHIPEPIKELGGILGAGIATIGFILAVGAVGLGFIGALTYMGKKMDEFLNKSNVNKQEQVIEQSPINAKEADKVSLQIDSLNNLYKNKSITSDEFTKGLDKIYKNNSQTEQVPKK